MEVIYQKEEVCAPHITQGVMHKEYQFCSLALCWHDQDTLKCSVINMRMQYKIMIAMGSFSIAIHPKGLFSEL
jgi:hypothetical protein